MLTVDCCCLCVCARVRACCRMREALTYLAHAYETNATLLKNGEKRGMDPSVIAVYRRKCLSVSEVALSLGKSQTPDTVHKRFTIPPPSSVHHAGTERERVTSVLQRRRGQRGGRCGHHGRGRHPLPAPDEPRPGLMPGRPGGHGEHPRPLVLLPEPRHGR